jgi:hypothetical protein
VSFDLPCIDHVAVWSQIQIVGMQSIKTPVADECRLKFCHPLHNVNEIKDHAAFSPRAKLFHEEPEAGNPHIRICEG